MKAQTITIKNLGPVKNFKMDITKFNILIGEQATGKSTIAKCIYFFRTVKTYITYYFQSIYHSGTYHGKDISLGIVKNLKSELKSVFISLFGYSWDLDDRLYLRYEFTDAIWIDVSLNKGTRKQDKYIDVRFSEQLFGELSKLQSEVIQLNREKSQPIMASLDYITQERAKQHNLIKNKVDNLFEDVLETYYIPAGRSMITLLSSNRTSLNSDNLDLVTRQFMRLIESVQGFFGNGIFEAHKYFPSGDIRFDIESLSARIVQILKGDYERKIGGEQLIMSDGQKVAINFISSGQQEVLWLLNLLYILMLKKERAFVIIEEPEAHLYPSLQQEIIGFISFFANINDSSVFITTHSPYVLTISNVYYCAGKIMEQLKGSDAVLKVELEKEVYKIIERKREFLPHSFSAFKLNKDDTFESLINDDFGEISSELIDEISDITSQMYMDLFRLSEEYFSEEESAV